MGRAHLLIARVAPLSLPLLVIHVVRFDQLALCVNLEDTWEEGGPWRSRIVFVAKVVPLLPLVDEDAQVGRVLIQAEE